MQCASASSSISRLRVRAMVDSSYQLRRLESDDSSPHRARKVTLGRPTSTSATRRSMSSSRPAAAALPDGRPVGCVSRLACVGSDSLFQSVVSSGVGHTHALTRGPRPRAPRDGYRRTRYPAPNDISRRTQDRILIRKEIARSEGCTLRPELALLRYRSARRVSVRFDFARSVRVHGRWCVLTS
jgi:hypothetical protein